MKWRLLNNFSLVVLLATVGLRPLVSESFHTSNGASELAAELHDPVTWHTLIINIAIFGVSLLVACRSRFVKGVRIKRCGIEAGALLLLVASITACWNAAEQRPARLAAIDLLGALALTWSLVQLLEFQWQRLLTLSVILASGLINVAETFDQSFYTMRETQKQYEQDRESIWAEKGVALDSPQVTMFENRMRSREATGYFSHSNIFGGYMLLVLFAAIGMSLFALRIRPPDGGVGLMVTYAVFACAAGLAVYLSNGLGPLISGALMLVLLAVVLSRMNWWSKHRGRVFLCSVWLVMFVAIGVALYGTTTNSLPGMSLDFRWQYWTASSQMFQDHWQTGVGPENFGDAYLQYKTIGNSEEVKNPHSPLVQFATEYGFLGLIGFVLLLAGGAKAYANTMIDADQEQGIQRNDAEGHSIVTPYVTILVFITLIMFVCRHAMLPSQDSAFVAWSLIMAMPAWILVHGVGVLLAARTEGFWAASGRSMALSRGMPAIGFGLAAFLLQDTINFAFFVPGSRTTLAAMFALAIARVSNADESNSPVEQGKSRQEFAGLGVLLPLVFVFGWSIYESTSVISAEKALREARNLHAAGRATESINEQYLEARRLDSLDAEIPKEHARWLTRSANNGALTASQVSTDLANALDAINEAVKRAPTKHSFYRLKSQIHLLRHQIGIASEATQAVEAMRTAITLYPSRPTSYIELADCLAEVATCEALKEALEHLRHAVDLDDERPQWEEVRRLSPRVKGEIDMRKNRIAAMIDERECGKLGQ